MDLKLRKLIFQLNFVLNFLHLALDLIKLLRKQSKKHFSEKNQPFKPSPHLRFWPHLTSLSYLAQSWLKRLRLLQSNLLMFLHLRFLLKLPELIWAALDLVLWLVPEVKLCQNLFTEVLALIQSFPVVLMRKHSQHLNSKPQQSPSSFKLLSLLNRFLQYLCRNSLSMV